MKLIESFIIFNCKEEGNGKCTMPGEWNGAHKLSII